MLKLKTLDDIYIRKIAYVREKLMLEMPHRWVLHCPWKYFFLSRVCKHIFSRMVDIFNPVMYVLTYFFFSQHQSKYKWWEQCIVIKIMKEVQKSCWGLQISNSNNPAVRGNQWDVASLEGLAIGVLSDTLRYAKTVFKCLYFGTKNGWWFGHSKRTYRNCC